MYLRPRHWLTALGLAMMTHLGIAYWLQTSSSSPSKLMQRSLSLSLAPAGPAATQATATTTATLPTLSPVPPETIETVETVSPEVTAATAVAPQATTAMNADPPAKHTAKVSPKRLSEKPSFSIPEEARVERTEPKSRNEPVEPLKQPATSSAQRAKPVKTPNEKFAPSTDLSKISNGRTGELKATSNNSAEATPVRATPLPGNPKPSYPRIARSRGYEGQVVIQVTITSSGTVSQALIEQSSGHGILDSAALRTVKRWRFQPAHRHGQPVSVTLDIPITFRLQDG